MVNVFLFVIFAYFLIVSLVLALVLIPQARHHSGEFLGRTFRRGAELASRLLQQGVDRASGGANPVIDASLRGVRTVARHWKWCLASVAILALVPTVMALLRERNAFEGYDHTATSSVNSHIASLLLGEQLVAPPPLPPELFMTREVERYVPMASTANRQWELLDADFRQRLLLVFQIMREKHGYEMALIEGYRSPQRQAQLAALGPQVTRAGANESYHQYGLGADCAFIQNGKLVISEQDPWAARGYELYGETAAAVGLVWGGSWRNLRDLGHVELRKPGVMSKK